MTNEFKASELSTKYFEKILVSKNLSVDDFEKNYSILKNDVGNNILWSFTVLKALENDFSFLQPLAHHLIDNNYCALGFTELKVAALVAYQFEDAINKMNNVENDINKTMKDFYFDEKIKITNQPIEQIYNLAKKIVNQSNDDDIEQLKQFFISSNLSITTSEIFNKNKKSLKP